jgi:hypothetical protein
VLPAPDDRLPGTFDQDVYVEIMHRYHGAGAPADGTITFTLHAFLRTMGRRVDGRTYEQLRGALTRLERTVLESTAAYFSAATPGRPDGKALDGQDAAPEAGARPNPPLPGRYIDDRLTILTAVAIDRRRFADRDQLGLFPTLTSHEPGEARVTLAPILRANIAAGWAAPLSPAQYFGLASPMARRLYRLLSAIRSGGAGGDVGWVNGGGGAGGGVGGGGGGGGGGSGGSAPPMTWDVALEALAEQLPLSQRYPSHLQRVLEPAHSLLKTAGLVREAIVRQQRRTWFVHYELL